MRSSFFQLLSLLLIISVHIHRSDRQHYRLGVVHAEGVVLPPQPPVWVSDDIVGVFRQYSADSSDYVDDSSGRDVYLHTPAQIAKLDERTLVFADSGVHMVRKYDAVSDIASSVAGLFFIPGADEGSNPLGKPCFNRPSGIAVTHDANYIYVSNESSGTVSRVNVGNDTVEIVAGTSGDSETPYAGNLALGKTLHRPGFLSFNDEEHLVIPSTENNDILKLVNAPKHGAPKDGRLIRLDSPFSAPFSVTFHPHDGSAIISTSSSCLYHATFSEGTTTIHMTICSDGGYADGSPSEARFGSQTTTLWSPGGEVLFIADSNNNRIRYMPHDLSFVSTLAGNGTDGNDPGSAEQATLTNPVGLALLNSSLYFTQQTGRNIRRIDLPKCSVGEGFNWKTSQCDTCAVGHFSGDNSTFCHPCPPGTFANETGQAECVPCSAGLASAEGASICVMECSAGFVHQGVNNEMCVECPEGTFSEESGLLKCKPCPSGTASNKKRATSISTCATCPVGTYQNVEGQERCILCPAGSFSNETGSTECVLCPVGTYSEDEGAINDLTCKKCARGWYQNTTGQMTCITCQPGYFQDKEGQISCKPCETGTYQKFEARPSCMECEQGTFQNRTGQTTCIPCGVGHYQNKNGQPKCEPCTAGTYEDEEGKRECKQCGPGTHQNDEGQTTCKQCPAGTFEEKFGAVFCTSCPRGTASHTLGADNESVCQFCDPGFFSGPEGSTSCTICPAGTHQPFQKSAECIPCDFGTYSSEEGSLSCEECQSEDQFCSLGSSAPIHRSLRINTTNSMDPFFSTISERTSDNQDKLFVIRFVTIVACIVIIVLQVIFAILVFIVLPRAATRNTPSRLPVRFDKWLTKVDVFPKQHWIPMRATPVKRKTFLGGLCSIVFVVLVLAIVTLTVTEFFTINQFERMTIVAENILISGFSQTSVDMRVPGQYVFHFTLHNVMDPECALSSYSITGLMSAKEEKTELDDGGSEVIHIETERLSGSSACSFLINCTYCFFSSSNPTVSLHMDGNPLAMASSITYHLQIPHFYGEEPLIIEQVIAPRDPLFVLKGSRPTHIPLSLTKTLFLRLSDDHFMFSLFSGVLKIMPQWSNPTTIGYTVMHNPVELGSVAKSSNFHSECGLSVQLSLQVNPNALLIEEESKYSTLDLMSKTGALISSLAVVVVLLMNCTEEHCLHSLPRTTSLLSMRMKRRVAQTDNQSDYKDDLGKVDNVEPGTMLTDGDREDVELGDMKRTPDMQTISPEMADLQTLVRELSAKQDATTRMLEEKSNVMRELREELRDQASVIGELRRRIPSEHFEYPQNY